MPCIDIQLTPGSETEFTEADLSLDIKPGLEGDPNGFQIGLIKDGVLKTYKNFFRNTYINRENAQIKVIKDGVSGLSMNAFFGNEGGALTICNQEAIVQRTITKLELIGPAVGLPYAGGIGLPLNYDPLSNEWSATAVELVAGGMKFRVNEDDNTMFSDSTITIASVTTIQLGGAEMIVTIGDEGTYDLVVTYPALLDELEYEFTV